MTIARRVLVAGAGVAGLSVAYWLTRHGFSVTVIERLPFVPAMGRNVHVREPGREVLRRMGLERDIAALGFDEPVNVFVDAEGRSIVRLSMAGNAQPQREMLRGDLIRLFQRTLDDRVEFRVHEEIASLQQDSEHVVVQFRHGRCGSCDLVVVAEGSRSATRDLVFVQEADVRDLEVAMGRLSSSEDDAGSSIRAAVQCNRSPQRHPQARSRRSDDGNPGDRRRAWGDGGLGTRGSSRAVSRAVS